MPVTVSDQSISLSSSGYADGLGRRALEVERETGEMIERLIVRPEQTAFEHVLSARVARAALIKDDRFARPRAVSWDDEGRLTVTSKYVGGRRLSDVIDLSAAAGVIGGLDAAIGLLLELLPALSCLHNEAKFAHGVLGTGRLTVTGSGSLVILDWVYGATVEHLQLNRQRLWDELGVAAHPSPGPPRLDIASDLTQAAMIAAALVVGRPLCDNDYPSGIPSLRGEIVDVAQIRGNQEFVRGIERFFDRVLPIRPRRVFASADEALFELHQLARNTIGVEVCRAAFREFLHEAEKVDPEAYQAASRLEGPSHEHRIDSLESRPGAASGEPKAQPLGTQKTAKSDRREIAPIPVERYALEQMAIERVEQERRAREQAERADREKAEAERVERDRIEREHAIREMEELQRRGREKAEAERTAREKAEAERIAREQAEAERVAREQAERIAREQAEAERVAQERAEAERAAREGSETEQRVQPAENDPLAPPDDTDTEPPHDEDVQPEPEEVEPETEDSATTAAAPTVVEDEPLVQDSRRRRKKDRSARARKDKLRSASKPSGNRDKGKPGSSWLVRPDRAAAFDPVHPAAPPPAPPVASPTVDAPQPPPASLSPAVENPVEPVPEIAVQPRQPEPPRPPAATPRAAQPEVRPVFQTIKLKTPEGRQHGKITRATTRPASIEPPTPDFPQRAPYESLGGERRMPWKSLAAAIVILMGGGYAAMTFRAPGPLKPGAATATASTATPTPVPAAATEGTVEIATQPTGARVMFDNKPAGQSPVTVPNVSPGRHIVTVLAEAGTVKRAVKVEAGATAHLDISIFSGFAAISAPIVLEVAENGRSLGTSENHIMLTPGRHELRLTNRALQYTTTETVDVEPGEVKEVKLDPQGAVNINAQPWAEVWIDGAKIGDTPLANLSLPLGSREIVFRHPQFGERKVMATITAGAPANISVDLSK
jgi:hypothetical protein